MRRWMQPRNALAGSRYEAKLGPPVLVAYGASWHLAEHEKLALWRALCQARWSLASGWRDHLIHFHPEGEDARQFVAVECNPARVVQILENLVREGVLSRETASRIEMKLLRQVTAQGQWVGSPRP